MSRVSTHFKRSEFACKCGCGFDVVDIELLGVLEDVREYFRDQVRITSGCRCKAHNAAVGGSPTSQHLNGLAADIIVKGVSPKEVAGYLETKYSGYGIGRYPHFTHIDVRKGKSRWHNGFY